MKRSQASLVNMTVQRPSFMSTSIIASLKASIARIRLLVWLCSSALSATCTRRSSNAAPTLLGMQYSQGSVPRRVGQKQTTHGPGIEQLNRLVAVRQQRKRVLVLRKRRAIATAAGP